MRLIDADELLKPVGSYERVKYTYEYGDVVTVEDIELMPTIEAESIIRCKNCEYYNGEDKYCVNDIFAKSNGYCMYGKEKDE